MKKLNIKSIFPYVGLIFVLIFFGVLTGGKLFSSLALQALLNSLIYVLIASVGYAFLMAQGELDFSIGGIMAVSCAVAARAANVSPVLSVLAGVAAGALIGLINGFVVVKLRVSSFITTLAMMYLCQSAVIVVLGNGILAAPLSMLDWYTMPFKLVLIATFAVGGFLLFEHTAYGKSVRAIGACRETARQSGIAVKRIKLSSFVCMGAIMGLLGFVSLIRSGSATSATGSTMMIDVLVAVLVGGLPFSGGTTARFRSVIIGALIMTVIASGMTMIGASSVVQQIVKGAVFLVTVTISFERKNVKVIK